MPKTISLKSILFISIPILILFMFTLRQCLSTENIQAVKETYTAVKEVRNIVKFGEEVNEFAEDVAKTEATTSTTTNNNEPDSSEYYKYYTKEQLTEMKKECYPKPIRDGVREYHAIDQSVNKWNGVKYQEFMETAKQKPYEYPTASGKFYKSTKEWTMPLEEHNGTLKAATIYRTKGNYMKEFLKVKNK